MSPMAIDLVRKACRQYVPVGRPAAHAGEDMTFKLAAYEDNGAVAVLESVDGEQFRMPSQKVFDPNVALELAATMPLNEANN